MDNSDILERLFPGYRLVCRLFARNLGIDLTKTVTFLFVVFALFKSTRYVWTSISSVLVTWLTSSVEVSSRDGDDRKVFRDVLRWVGGNVVGGEGERHTVWGGARSLAVASAALDEDGGGQYDGTGKARNGLKVGKGGDAYRLRYEPAVNSTTWFLRGWHIFFLQRHRESDGSQRWETLTVTCVGFSTQPIRSFLQDCVVTSDRSKQIKQT